MGAAKFGHTHKGSSCSAVPRQVPRTSRLEADSNQREVLKDAKDGRGPQDGLVVELEAIADGQEGEQKDIDPAYQLATRGCGECIAFALEILIMLKS